MNYSGERYQDLWSSGIVLDEKEFQPDRIIYCGISYVTLTREA